MFNKLYREFFYVPKYAKMTDKVFKSRISASVLTMIVCCAVFCATSFAWFTSTQSSGVANIQTATYSVTVTATKGDTAITVNESNGISDISLEAESEYTITITVGGNAKSGYCKIEFRETIGETVYYTPQITSNNINIFVFKVKANSDGILIITPQWGTCSATKSITESIELGTKSVIDNDEPDDEVTKTPQTPATPESTKPTVDNGTGAITPSETGGSVSDNNIVEQEQKTESEETTVTDTKNE